MDRCENMPLHPAAAAYYTQISLSLSLSLSLCVCLFGT